MRILLINPPHPSIGSRIPHEHLPPLGLLAIGGPLLDAGHSVRLLDADLHNLTTSEIVSHTRDFAPQAILIGHSGSTSAHPVVVDVTRALRTALPDTWIIYGGVFPTYHWREIMAKEPQIDVIVRGEGEKTTPRVIQALENGTSLGAVFGIAYRKGKALFATLPAPLIDDLNRLRVGWELIDPRQYSYWGDRRAVVVQFSRGCSHACTYCGQSGFWTRWRHRDPKLFAAEIARLHRQHGIEVFNFADEHPTALKAVWQAFLEALIGEQVAVILVGSTRADDIVRDADILNLSIRRPCAGSARAPTLTRIANRSDCCVSTASCRWRPTQSVSKKKATATTCMSSARFSLTTPISCRCSTSLRTAGRRITARQRPDGSSKATAGVGITSIRFSPVDTSPRGACSSGSSSSK